MELTSGKVEKIYKDCLYNQQEIEKIGRNKIEEKALIIEGITNKHGFNPEKVKMYKEEIEGLVEELPDKFKDGWSFLNLCMDKYGS